MQRYNVFNQIHKGLRGMLYDTALRLQQTDFTQPEAETTIGQLEDVLHYFDGHAEHEDAYILPHIRQHHAPLIDELEQEHDADHALSQLLFEAISDWRVASDATTRAAIGQHIGYAFNAFVAFNLYHMNKEEEVLLPRLWEHYSDGEILQMEEQIKLAVDPNKLMAQCRWMMRSISNPEVIAWLSGVKRHAPAPVFDAFMGMAQDELPTQRLATVQRALSGMN